MDLIKLLDVSNPKKVKDTINILITNYEGFHDEISDIANAAAVQAEQAQQLASSAQQSAANALDAAANADTAASEAAISASDATVEANIATQAAIEAVETSELALQNANDATEMSERAMDVASEAKSTVDQAISTGVFGTFVYDTNRFALTKVYSTDDVNQDNTGEDKYLATPKLVKDVADTKVDKITGKQLSTNDYTTTEKDKLADISLDTLAFAESEYNKSKNLLYLASSQVTINGVAYTLNENTQSININGTSTGSTSGKIGNLKEPLTLKAGKTYILSARDIDGNYPNKYTEISLYNTTSGLYGSSFGGNLQTPVTITFSEDKTFNALKQYFGTGYSYDNVTYYLQVEENNSVTSYQKYNGDIIHENDPVIVFSENERQLSKNLVDVTSASSTYRDVSWEVNKDTQQLTFNGTASAYIEMHVCSLNKPISVKSGETYTLSLIIVSGTTSATNYYPNFTINLYNKATGYYSNNFDANLGTATIKTFTSDLTFDAIRIWANSGVSFSNLVVKVQVEKGGVASKWVFPYGDIVHEKDIENVEHIQVIFDKNGKLAPNTATVSGVDTAYSEGLPTGNTYYFYNIFSKCKKLRFTFSTENTLTTAEVDLQTLSANPNIEVYIPFSPVATTTRRLRIWGGYSGSNFTTDFVILNSAGESNVDNTSKVVLIEGVLK